MLFHQDFILLRTFTQLEVAGKTEHVGTQMTLHHLSNLMKKQNSRAGLTLIEILATLAIMSIFTVVAITSMGNVVDDARFDATVREMQQIRAAIVGETVRLESGLRKNYGF